MADDVDNVLDNSDLEAVVAIVAVDDKSIHSFALVFAVLAAIDDNDDDDILDSLIGFSVLGVSSSSSSSDWIPYNLFYFNQNNFWSVCFYF